jgi:hypothetical protein
MIKYIKRLILFPTGVWGNTVFSGYIYALTNSSVQVYICCRLRGIQVWSFSPSRKVGLSEGVHGIAHLVAALASAFFLDQEGDWISKLWNALNMKVSMIADTWSADALIWLKSVAQIFCRSLSFFNQQGSIPFTWMSDQGAWEGGIATWLPPAFLDWLHLLPPFYLWYLMLWVH